MPTALIIDDMQVFATAVGAMLRAAGFEVKTANDGRAGLALLQSLRPSVVLLDNAMPVMSGIQVLRAMREHPDAEWAATPVILLSATADAELAREAKALGVREQMLKSRFTLAELLAVVRRVTSEPKPQPAAPLTGTANGLPE